MAMHAPLRVQDVNLTDVELFVQGQAHEVWRLLRAEAPVHWNPGTDALPRVLVCHALRGCGRRLAGYHDLQFAPRHLDDGRSRRSGPGLRGREDAHHD